MSDIRALPATPDRAGGPSDLSPASGSQPKALIPSAWGPFNLNENVRIKITPRGIEHMRREHDRRNACYHGNPFGEFKPPVADAEGWTKWQLWRVMQEFGSAIAMGTEPPFELTIELETRAAQGIVTATAD